MANEITVLTQLKASKTNFQFDSTNLVKRYTLNGAAKSAGTQIIGTTQEQVVLGADLGTAGWSIFTNLDATNYLEIGLYISSVFYPVLKLKAGETAVCRLGTSTFYAKANTANCVLDFTILSD